MKLVSFEAIARALHEASVRYLVAGGLAVNAHGFLRFTKDVDLVIQLDADNLGRALSALGGLGYEPAIPATFAQFADPVQRERWVREKNMQVFQLWSDNHLETPIDIFVTEPFGFDEEYSRAVIKPLLDDLPVRFVSIPSEDWAAATFEGARREQIRRWSKLPLRQVIEALEEMEQLANRLGSDSPPSSSRDK